MPSIYLFNLLSSVNERIVLCQKLMLIFASKLKDKTASSQAKTKRNYLRLRDIKSNLYKSFADTCRRIEDDIFGTSLTELLTE